MSVAAIESIPSKRKNSALNHVPLETQTPLNIAPTGSLSFSERTSASQAALTKSVTFSDGSIPTTPISRPKLDPPGKFGSMVSLIGFVDRVEELKKELQEVSLEEINRLSHVLKEVRKDLHLAEKSALKAKQRAKYASLIKDGLLFISTAATFVSLGSWQNASNQLKLLQAVTIGLSTANLTMTGLEKMNLIENKYKNVLLGLNLLSFGATFYFSPSSAANVSNSVQKLVRTSLGVSEAMAGVSEGHNGYRSVEFSKEAMEHSHKVKKNEDRTKDQLDQTLFMQKRLQLEQDVAKILHEYQSMIQQIQRHYEG
ncbi:MAG: hypothetical protein FJZ60_01010 [Chlamydiae bacterium]|nr:hypothetical protein [Chlamydiota bacterium]